jgi:hypothetical protein
MIEIRRLPRIVALLLCSALFMTCASSNATGDGGSVSPSGSSPELRANPCSTGKGFASPNTPVVCVDDSVTPFRVHPDPIVVHDVSAKDRRPVTIQWMTVSGGRIGINMKSSECVTSMKCANGKCTAKTIAHKAAETGERRCKYDIITDKGTLDPDTVIVKCCTVPEPEPTP